MAVRTAASHRSSNTISVEQRRRWIAVARGDEPADLVLRGGQVISVFTSEIFPSDVAICDGMIVAVGEGYRGTEEIDVSGKFVSPGFIDGHCHIESSKLSVHEFARAVLRCGTTTVVVDPHELANVLGVAGIEYVLEASEGIPLNVSVMVPSCVPASQFESPLQPLSAADFGPVLGHPRVLGLAEMMNYPAVISGDTDVLEKMAAFGWSHIDGHAPSVSGKRLNAYLIGGPHTDHECVTLAEALEKRRLGMWIMIREATMIRNLVDLIGLVRDHGTDNTLFVTDDREADTLLHEGHINAMIQLAVRQGLSVNEAVRLASLNVARCQGIEGVGAVAPGYSADLCVFPDLNQFTPDLVLASGAVVVRNGAVEPFPIAEVIPPVVRNTVTLPSLDERAFLVPAGSADRIRVIGIIPDQVITESEEWAPKIADGEWVADSERDLSKLAVIERHGGSGQVGLGFVHGFGLQDGAIASSIGHDAHNVLVAGVNDADMLRAARRLSEIGGGLVVVSEGKVRGELALPIAGLMTDRPAEEVDARLKQLDQTLAGLGVSLPTPFMYLGFLALSVIPALRLTDQGLVDVSRFELVPLAVS